MIGKLTNWKGKFSIKLKLLTKTFYDQMTVTQLQKNSITDLSTRIR